MGRTAVEVRCPHCRTNVCLTEDKKGRWVKSFGGFTVGSLVGVTIAAGIGLAFGGWGTTATIPVGLVLGAILGGSGFILRDKIIDNFTCPSCGVHVTRTSNEASQVGHH